MTQTDQTQLPTAPETTISPEELAAFRAYQARIQRGLTLGKRGYEEIYSRLGRHFIRLDSIDDEDVALVCSRNGIENVSTIRQIAKESDYDLRMVRRAVWATLMRS